MLGGQQIDRIDRDTLLHSNNPKLMHFFSSLSNRGKLIIDLKCDLVIYIKPVNPTLSVYS